jgi:hypothetical protein
MRNRKVWLWVTFSWMFFLSVFDASAQTQEPYYAKRTVWDSYTGGDLNISGFVFRDLNRNGIYDLADRPMANVVFELVGPAGLQAITRSNINGFANFRMSALMKDADIVERGSYEYRTKIPPGWILTTGNAVQSTSFEIFPGSPADMVSSTPASPVGLAPILRIEGRAATPVTLLATAPNGTKRPVILDDDGHFTIPATPGSWLLQIIDKLNGRQVQRAVIVGRVPIRLSTISFSNLTRDRTARVNHTVQFDDLIKAVSIVEIPTGYGDLGWHNWVVTHRLMYGGEGYINTTNSGEFVAYNSSGHPVRIYREKPFDFRGGYFGVAWANAEGETLTIRAWRNNELIYEDSLPLSTLGPTFFDADYRSVTRIEFATSHFWQFVCDDLSIGLDE